MKHIVLTMTAMLVTASVLTSDVSVDDLRDIRGDDYKKLRDAKVKRASASTHAAQNADSKERILLDIIKSRKATPQTYSELAEIIQASRQNRSDWTEKQRKQSINPRSALLMPRIMRFAGQRGQKFKSEEARLALVESLWKLVEDDYERLNLILVLSDLVESKDEDLIPIICSVLRDTEHPELIKYSLLLLAKLDATFADAEIKVQVRNAVATSLPSCVEDLECRNVCKVMLQKIGGAESDQLIELLESHAVQKVETPKPLVKVEEDDIVIDVE